MYDGVLRIFKVYWTAYGGSRALLRSPYLHLAALVLGLTWNTWWSPQWASTGGWVAWWDQSLSVLPNLLGFSLGGFAIFIGFGDEKFRGLLADPALDTGNKNATLPTMYVELCASFVHFILVQALALVLAVIFKSWWFYSPNMDFARHWLPSLNAIGGFVGYGLFLYALTCVVAATMHVFRIANMYAKFRHSSFNEQASSSEPGRAKQME